MITGVTAAGVAVGGGIELFGLFFWPSTASEPSIVLVGVGVYLSAVSLCGLLWLRRLMRRSMESVRQTEGGIQVVLKDGTVLRREWTDRRFAIDLWTSSQAARTPPVRFGMAWKMDRTVAGCVLTEGGWNQLVAAARSRGLSVTEKCYGKGSNTGTTYLVRAAASK